MKKAPKYLVGIDEVGRGPLAGPVAVGACIFLVDPKSAIFKKHFAGVRESKQLSEIRREEWFAKILAARDIGLIEYAVTFVSERTIDTRGLSYAIRHALERSLRTVVKGIVDMNDVEVRLDGGLRAPVDFIHQKTIIKGDVKEPCIALASICAKVLRDRRMRTYAKKYPQYGFEVHKGYGTRAHYASIKKFGLTPLHRRSFLKSLKSSSINLAKKPNMR
ncbi:MAG: ribonuclease ribonuclease [Candidatus Parcubacteria bacterium]|jgi:ribonuclease HII